MMSKMQNIKNLLLCNEMISMAAKV